MRCRHSRRSCGRGCCNKKAVPAGTALNTFATKASLTHLVGVPGEFAGGRVFADAVAVVEAEGVALGEFGRGVDEAAQEEGFDVRVRLRQRRN